MHIAYHQLSKQLVLTNVNDLCNIMNYKKLEFSKEIVADMKRSK